MLVAGKSLDEHLSQCEPEVSHLIRYWFSKGDKYNEAWFNGSIDLEVREEFSDMLKRAESGELDKWSCSLIGRLALIIILDQITRNLYRDGDFRKNDVKAYNLAKWSLLTLKDRQYPLVMRLFLLLPLRHARTTDDLDWVLTILKEYFNEFTRKEDVSILNRFFNATLRDYSKVTDTIQVTNSYTGKYPVLDQKVLDERCLQYTTSDLLLNMDSDIESNPLYQAVESWSREYLSGDKTGLCVSLSGGVDSMVLLYLCYQLYLRKKISRLVAVHIDYGNRDESAQEAAFVQEWVKFFGIPLYTRRIDHIKRGEIDRKVYEDETKRIRFALYHYVLDLYPDIYGVGLGHHQGDLVENVLMNVFRNRDLLDLNKMHSVSVCDGVKICRPMLELPKSDVYSVAHMRFIPYMRDTTCETCVRGLLRNEILPRVEKVQDSFNNILATGKTSDSWSEVVNSMIVQPIVDSVEDSQLGFRVTLPKTMKHFVVWCKVFAEIFQRRGLRMVSHENIRILMSPGKKSNRLIVLSNGCVATIKNDSYYFMYSKYLVPVTPTEFNLQERMSLGKWTVTMEKTKEFIKTPSRLSDLFSQGLVYTLPNYGCFRVVKTVPRNSSTRSRIRLGKISPYIPKIESIVKDVQDGYVKVTIKPTN